MLDLEGLDEVQAYESIKRLSEDLDPRMRPLIALDNLTTLQELTASRRWSACCAP
ncbi:MAG: hypothetical protein ACLTSX_11640 [Collinsella sp.]